MAVFYLLYPVLAKESSFFANRRPEIIFQAKCAERPCRQAAAGRRNAPGGQRADPSAALRRKKAKKRGGCRRLFIRGSKFRRHETKPSHNCHIFPVYFWENYGAKHRGGPNLDRSKKPNEAIRQPYSRKGSELHRRGRQNLRLSGTERRR